MDYPDDFSPQARARIEAERLKAGGDFEEIGTQPLRLRRRRSVAYGLRWTDAEEDVHTYILRVFLAFALEECELGRKGTWGPDRICSESEFLHRFTMIAYSEKGHD